jgi:prefoldin subunit 5
MAVSTIVASAGLWYEIRTYSDVTAIATAAEKFKLAIGPLLNKEAAAKRDAQAIPAVVAEVRGLPKLLDAAQKLQTQAADLGREIDSLEKEVTERSQIIERLRNARGEVLDFVPVDLAVLGTTPGLQEARQWEQIAGLLGRLNELGEQRRELEDKVRQLEEQLSSQPDDAALAGELAATQAELKDLLDERERLIDRYDEILTEMDQELGAKGARLGQLRQELEALQARVADLHRRIAELATCVEQLGVEISLREDIEEVVAALNARQAELNTRIDELQKSIMKLSADYAEQLAGLLQALDLSRRASHEPSRLLGGMAADLVGATLILGGLHRVSRRHFRAKRKKLGPVNLLDSASLLLPPLEKLRDRYSAHGCPPRVTILWARLLLALYTTLLALTFT